MYVMNQLIEQSVLQGMPSWLKALAIAILLSVISLILITLIMLLKDGATTVVNYGYLYNN